MFSPHCAQTQRRWMVTGAAGAPGAAADPPWRGIERGAAITLRQSGVGNLALVPTGRRTRVMSRSLNGTCANNMVTWNNDSWFLFFFYCLIFSLTSNSSNHLPSSSGRSRATMTTTTLSASGLSYRRVRRAVWDRRAPATASSGSAVLLTHGLSKRAS